MMYRELTLVLLLVGLVSSQTYPQELDAEVIIIGAGMAGVSAAKRLDELDIKNVIILEGSSRVGGWLTSAEFAGVRVSLGPNWIQGIDPASPELHPLYRLAQECLQGGIRGVYMNYDSLTSFNSQGQQNEQELRWDDYDNALAAVRNLQSECVSLRQALNESGWTPTNAADNWVEWFNADFCFGEAPNDVSILSTMGKSYTSFAAPESEGEDYYITDTNGYETIIECLANEVVANGQGQLVLNAFVTTIDWSNDDCVCMSVNVSGTINQYCSRYAISTVSTGVLQSESIQFNPELPEWKKEAIQKFVLTRYIHIFMEFSEVFWNTTEIIRYIANERGYYPVFFNLNLIYPENPKILMAVVTGEEVDRIHSQTETETIAEIEQILSKIYPNSNTTVVDWIIPNWIANPLFRGTFTYLPTDFKSKDFKLLAAPVGNLHFSGEATSANFSGFVHGAYFSGIDTAELIASQITSKAMFAQAGFIITVLGMICAIYMH
ncbi:uncharacterized protein LOC135349512 [Halichondria panicea]|uniref:uncharacterized protein LOC135349512 n=1 Tax=Halichondria panicea TaxID=6063 RepID=UPI00312BA4C3